MARVGASFRLSSNWTATLVAVCVAQATAIAGFDFTLPFIPLYLQHDLGIHGLAQTALWAGLIGFGPALPATIFGPMWGRLADRIGYRAMLLRAMGCAALMLALMGLAPTAGILFLLRLIQGGLTGTIYAAQALVAASAPERETGRAMGLLQMSVYVGATFGPIGGGAMAELLGYRAAFISAGVLIAVATLVVFLFVAEPARRSTREETKVERRPSILSLLLMPAFAVGLVLTFAVQLSATALLPIIPLYAQQLLGSAQDVARDTGWLFALSGVAGALGSYLAGRWQRRLGLRPMLIGSIALSALLVLPQAFVQTFVDFLVLRSLAAFAFGALFGLVGAWAATTSPKQAKGAAFGLMGAASSLGFGSGPLLGGAIVAATGIRPLFAISAAAIVVLPLALLGLVLVASRLFGHVPERAAIPTA